MDYLTVAAILFALGVILLIAEVLLPTGGFLVVASLVFFAAGVCVIFVQGTTTEAVVAMGGLALGFPIFGVVAVSAWRRLSLGSVLNDDSGSVTAASGAADFETLKNHVGKTVSPMRPSGSVEFDGRRMDAMSEGVMLEAGVWVRCVDVKGGKIIVRQIETPAGIAEIESGDEDFEPRPSPLRNVPPVAPPEPRPKPEDFDDFDLDLR
jgi:membrane-bound serine protease (ClpP class)